MYKVTSPQLRTAFGPRLAAPPAPMRAVNLTTSELHALAVLLDQQSSAADVAGQHGTARRLAWRAADLREAMRPAPSFESVSATHAARAARFFKTLPARTGEAVQG